jgi:hypothetical protein
MNLIYQYFEKPKLKDKNEIKVGFDYHLLSKQSISKYSYLISSDYKLYDDGSPHTAFYGIFLPFLNNDCYRYDKLCFIDSDVLSTRHIQNIFNSTSDEVISYNLMNMGNLVAKPIVSIEPWNEYGHGNSGVVVIPRSQYENLKKFIGNLDRLWSLNRDIMGGYDQLIINEFAKEHGYKNLDQRFNYHMGRYDQTKRFEMTLIHYHRKMKNKMQEDFREGIILK